MNCDTVSAARALVIADTHVRDAAQIPEAVYLLADKADLIIHAGDHSVLEVEIVLSQFAPVIGVRGNVEDLEVITALPDRRVVNAGALGLIGITHDPGPRAGRDDRLIGWFPRSRVIIYGHTHMPEARTSAGVLFLNPGSPTQRRRAPTHTVAWLELDAHGEPAAKIIDL